MRACFRACECESTKANPARWRLHMYDNPMIDPPSEVSDLGVEHVREYLRAVKVISAWDPDDVTEFNRHGLGG